MPLKIKQRLSYRTLSGPATKALKYWYFHSPWLWTPHTLHVQTFAFCANIFCAKGVSIDNVGRLDLRILSGVCGMRRTYTCTRTYTKVRSVIEKLGQVEGQWIEHWPSVVDTAPKGHIGPILSDERGSCPNLIIIAPLKEKRGVTLACVIYMGQSRSGYCANHSKNKNEHESEGGGGGRGECREWVGYPDEGTLANDCVVFESGARAVSPRSKAIEVAVIFWTQAQFFSTLCLNSTSSTYTRMWRMNAKVLTLKSQEIENVNDLIDYRWKYSSSHKQKQKNWWYSHKMTTTFQTTFANFV